MNPDKRKALEAAGYWVGDAEDFLGLTEGERNLVELRMKVASPLAARLNVAAAEPTIEEFEPPLDPGNPGVNAGGGR